MRFTRLTLKLDKIRGQAKHAAWYDEPGDPPSLNPFRKVRTGPLSRRNTLRNAENGDGELTRSITDQEQRHANVLNRQVEMGGGNNMRQRVGTAPNSGPADVKPNNGDPNLSIEIALTGKPKPESALTKAASPLPLDEPKDSMSSDTITPEIPASDEKPRKRKGLKGIFHWRKDGTEEKADEDDHEKPHYTFSNQLRATLFNSWINILLIAGKFDGGSMNAQLVDGF